MLVHVAIERTTEELATCESRLREAEAAAAAARERLAEANDRRAREIAQGRAVATLDAEREELARVTEVEKGCRRAVELARERLDKAKALATAQPDALAALERDLLQALARIDKLGAELGASIDELASLRSRAAPLLGDGHAIVEWPFAPLSAARQGLELWRNAPQLRPERWRKPDEPAAGRRGLLGRRAPS